METQARVLEPTAVRRLLSHVQRRRDATRARVIVLLSFHVGLRACEIAGLSWPMVLRPGGGGGEQLNIMGHIAKNGSGRRVPIAHELWQALDMLWRENGKPLVGPVVRSLRGGHVTARGVVNWFATLYAEVGLSGCSSLSGRRTFITRSARLLAKVGGSLRDVQELAGYRSIATTERYIKGDRDVQLRLIRLL